MISAIRTCALVGRFHDPRVTESTAALIPVLRKHGVAALVADDSTAGHAPPPDTQAVSREELVRRADVIIAIGGDGTLLYAAGLLDGRDVPLLGINRGRLGFLTDVLPQDMVASVSALLAGECITDRRPLLHATLTSPDGQRYQRYALNDVVFNRLETGRMLDFETRIDGQYVNSHGGDGLVVATATGSTAYALSCGGPIVTPELDVLVIAPICPHTLSDRPFLIGGQSVIEIRLIDDDAMCAQVTCDASVLGELRPGGRLCIEPGKRHVTLLHPPGYDYFRLLRSKLHWGLGGVTRER